MQEEHHYLTAIRVVIPIAPQSVTLPWLAQPSVAIACKPCFARPSLLRCFPQMETTLWSNPEIGKWECGGTCVEGFPAKTPAKTVAPRTFHRLPQRLISMDKRPLPDLPALKARLGGEGPHRYRGQHAASAVRISGVHRAGVRYQPPFHSCGIPRHGPISTTPGARSMAAHAARADKNDELRSGRQYSSSPCCPTSQYHFTSFCCLTSSNIPHPAPHLHFNATCNKNITNNVI
jgi:hypothetical protein